MKKFMKVLGLVACAAILVVGSVAATYAYLTAKTETFHNTFTAGNIIIEFKETDRNVNKQYKMVPGTVFTKDPSITVDITSESCWLFVEIEESTNFDTYMTYTVADGWIAVPDTTNVYYREVDTNVDDPTLLEFPILSGNSMVAKSDCTKDQYNQLSASNWPTLSFTAYAVQRAGFDSAEAAWREAQKLDQSAEQ